MPARCSKGFLFEDDLMSLTLHREILGLETSSVPGTHGSLSAVQERCRVHMATCPCCSRADTPDEDAIREEYQWKRALFHGSLNADVSLTSIEGVGWRAVGKARVSSAPARRLLREMVSLRSFLLRS